MRLRFPLLSALGALLLVGVAAAPVAAAGPAPDPAAARFEIKFMERTVEHHLLGVEMAQLCVARTTAPPPAGDATLRDRCATIAADQSAEAQQLQAWLQSWYGIDYQPRMSGSGQLMKLEKAQGEAFDIEVSQMFIEHHLRQIRMSSKCLVRAYHQELMAFCQHTIAEQSADIVVFRDILGQHGADTRG